MYSPGTSLPKRRVRIACNACKQKKQKCDGRTPACGNCIKNRRDCIIEDPSTKRPLPPGYVGTLEARVAMLEGLLKDVRPDIALDHLISDDISTSAALSREESAPTSTIIPTECEDEGSTPVTSGTSPPVVISNDTGQGANGIHSWIDMLCLNSAAGQSCYFGASSPLPFSRVLSSILRGIRFQGPTLTMAGIDNELIREMPRPGPAPLPSQIFCDLLTNVYFAQIHPQYPFLHEPTFRQWQGNVLAANDRAVPPDPVQLFFVYMVIAVGALISPAYSRCSAESLYAAAENLLDQVMKKSTFDSIQAILCCAMFSMRSSTGVSVWTLSGLALRQCIELGFHRKNLWKSEPDVLKDQMQKRVFWVAYNLDRAAAVSLGRPLGIMDRDIDVDPPADINDEDITPSGYTSELREECSEPATTMSGAVHTIRLRRIWGEIQSYIYPTQESSQDQAHDDATVEALRQKLRQWLEEQPRKLNSNEATDTVFGSAKWYSLSYNYTILLLHRRRLVIGSASSLSNRSSEDLSKVCLECAEAAATVCRIYREMYLSTTMSSSWGALHIMFLGGLTFLHCLWTNKAVREAWRVDAVASVCTSCTVGLVIMAERWSAAAPYRETFEMLSAATQSMLASVDDTRPSPSLPILNVSDQGSIAKHLGDISEIGMCDSVEHLLTEMIQ